MSSPAFGLRLPKLWILLLACCLNHLGCQKDTVSVNHGEKAPEFALLDLENNRCRLSQYLIKNEVVFIVFWADWCNFCKTGLKMMDGVYRRKRSSGFEILAINVKQNKERVLKLVERLRITYPVLLDYDADVSVHKYGVIAIPSFFLLDSQGVVREKVIGDLSDQQVIEIVDPYLHKLKD